MARSSVRLLQSLLQQVRSSWSAKQNWPPCLWDSNRHWHTRTPMTKSCPLNHTVSVQMALGFDIFCKFESLCLQGLLQRTLVVCPDNNLCAILTLQPHTCMKRKHWGC